MLTQYEVRSQLDALANDVARASGLYYELYSRLFSERVHRWINTTPGAEADLIRRIAEQDPDYAPAASTAAPRYRQEPLVNPEWDMDY